MGERRFFDWKTALLTGSLIVSLLCWWSILGQDSSRAFGGNFAPQMAQQGGGRYQIAGLDSHSAWIIDTAMGDVFIFYSNGKWKEAGSIMDEKMRLKK